MDGEKQRPQRNPAIHLAFRSVRALIRRPSALLKGPKYIRKWVRKTVAEAYTPPVEEQYREWQRRHALTDERRRRLEGECAALSQRPMVSILTPVYNTPEAFLRAAIESVRDQIYPHWELRLADDASPQHHVSKVIQEYASLDERIKVVSLETNRGIAGATNAALQIATGDFVGLLDHDDELTPDAVLEVVKRLNEEPDLDIVYSDEDKRDQNGDLINPFFKPDWSPSLLLCCNHVAHFSVYRRSLLQKLGGLRSEYDGSQDYDLILRAAEQTSRIAHLPRILYHWRMIAGSAAASEQAKPYAYDAAVRALDDTMKRRSLGGQAEKTEAPGRYRVRPVLPAGALVSIIIPTRDKAGLLRQCLRSIKERTSYRDYEIIVVDSAAQEPVPDDIAMAVSARIPYGAGPFNFSRAVNLGASLARGEYLLLLNDDTEVVSRGWIEAMLEQARRPEVGVVGAKLLDRKGDPQHEGIVLGIHDLPAANVAFSYLEMGDTLRDCSAITAACMLTKLDVFERLKGFDEGMALGWNDVDYCLRARQCGYYVVYTPWAALRHYESSTRGATRHLDDDAFFRARWGEPAALADPFYNPNFDRSRGPWLLGE